MASPPDTEREHLPLLTAEQILAIAGGGADRMTADQRAERRRRGIAKVRRVRAEYRVKLQLFDVWPVPTVCGARHRRRAPGARPVRRRGSRRAATTRAGPDDGAPDPEKVKAANSELLARRPHYAKRIGGDVGQGARPGPADPNEELWASSSPGRARYGDTGTAGSLRGG